MTALPRLALRDLLVLLPSTRFGGTERHSAELAARLVAHGMTVTLAAEAPLLGPITAALPPGLPAPRLVPAELGWDPTRPLAERQARQAEATAALLDDTCPDLALLPLPWPDAGLGALRALAAARLPRLVAFHLAPTGAAPAGIAEALPDLRAEAATWCAVSGPVARRGARAFGLPPARVAVLANPAPPPPATLADRPVARLRQRAALGLRPDARLLLFVGRLEKIKGADMLPGLTDRIGLPLVCVGDGPLRRHLDAEAAADPRGLLHMLGHTGDPTPWFLAADALVLPSRLEGTPLVFLEAASRLCPVVATRAALEGLGPAASRLARLVGEPDAASFADALRGLLADPAGTAEMTALAAAEAARRTWDRALPGWLGLLRAAPLAALSETQA